nr:MAG TPA: hypothetical protein [Caudoviricetes sp.]
MCVRGGPAIKISELKGFTLRLIEPNIILAVATESHSVPRRLSHR